MLNQGSNEPPPPPEGGSDRSKTVKEVVAFGRTSKKTNQIGFKAIPPLPKQSENCSNSNEANSATPTEVNSIKSSSHFVFGVRSVAAMVSAVEDTKGYLLLLLTCII
jgi:hypothetical protein